MAEPGAEKSGEKSQQSIEFKLEDKQLETLLAQALEARDKAYCG